MGDKRLIVISTALMLRRTKSKLLELGLIPDLPQKNVIIHQITLDKEELIVYQKLLLYSQTFFFEYLRQRKTKEFIKQHGFLARSKSLLVQGTLFFILF